MPKKKIMDNVFEYTKKNGTVSYQIRRYNNRTKKEEWRTVTPPEGMTSERKLKIFLSDERNKFIKEISNGLSETDSRIRFCDYFEGPVKDMFTGRAITWETYEGHYRRYIKDWFCNIRMADVNKVVIKKYFDYVESERNVGASTFNGIYRTMNKILNMAVDDDLLMKNPLSSKIVKMKEETPRTRCLTKSELEDLIIVLNNENLYWRSLLMVLITTAIRRGEVLGLHWEDVHLDCEYPYIEIKYSVEALEHQKPQLYAPKTPESNRIVFVPQLVADMLRELRNTFGYGIVFHGLAGPEHLRHPDSVNTYIKRMCARQHLPQFTPHVLRRTLATSLATREKIDPKTLQTILGHADIRTLLKFYVLPDAEAQRNALDTYNKGIEKALDKNVRSLSKANKKGEVST